MSTSLVSTPSSESAPLKGNPNQTDVERVAGAVVGLIGAEAAAKVIGHAGGLLIVDSAVLQKMSAAMLLRGDIAPVPQISNALLAMISGDPVAALPGLGRKSGPARPRGAKTLRHKSGRHWRMILPAVSELGAWEGQTFGVHGLDIRQSFGSQAEAIRNAEQAGYTEPDDGALERLAKVPAFRRAVHAQSLLERVGPGGLDFDEANAMLRAYDAEEQRQAPLAAHYAQGFYIPADGTTVLVADRIAPGKESAVYLHEVIHSRGMKVLGASAFDRLVSQVKAWANAEKSTPEWRIQSAAARRALASADITSPHYDEELFAYAVEEAVAAGVRPTLEGREGSAEQWLGDVVATLRGAIFQITQGAAPALDAQQIVDLAYALAQMEDPDRAREIMALLGNENGGAAKAGFDRWFDGSKMVDASGAPLVMYHGQPRPQGDAIESFEDRRHLDDGTYFTSDPAYAQAYAVEFRAELPSKEFGHTDKTGVIYPTYLAIRNPLVLSGEDDEQRDLYISRGFKVRDLEAQGYDGIMLRYEDGEIEAMVFRPEQIKSSIGNDGQFDPANSDIRYSRSTGLKRQGLKTGLEISTPEFSAWFGNSKVVAENGEPLVVYHGTADDFAAFDPAKIGSRHVDVEAGDAFFFSDDISTANWYAHSAGKQREEGANVMPVYLSLQNPKIIDFQGAGLEYLGDDIAAAKEGGHDGLIALNYDDGILATHYIAFRPEQMKSAMGNRGTFDPDSQDIRFSHPDAVLTDPNAIHQVMAEMQSACDRFEAGFHFEEGGCWGMALALQAQIGGELFLRDGDFVHVYVQLDGALYDWQGAARNVPGRAITELELRAMARSAGLDDEELGADVATAAAVIHEAREAAVATASAAVQGPRFSFAGPAALSANREALGAAQLRADAGEDREAIRRETGWFQGVDGKWKFEIDDSKGFTKGTGTFGDVIMKWYHLGVERTGQQLYATTVGDLIGHADLFSAYPQLRDIEVRMMPADHTALGTIAREAGGAPVIMVKEGLPATQWYSVLLHELQHQIQEIEGFAAGGAPDSFGAVPFELARDAGLLGQNLADHQIKHTLYRRLAGEVEARNTQARLHLRSAERVATAPGATADTPAIQQIVRFGDTTSGGLRSSLAGSEAATANASALTAAHALAEKGTVALQPAALHLLNDANEFLVLADVLRHDDLYATSPLAAYIPVSVGPLGDSSRHGPSPAIEVPLDCAFAMDSHQLVGVLQSGVWRAIGNLSANASDAASELFASPLGRTPRMGSSA